MTLANTAVVTWVENTARLTQPDRVVWLDGSDEEYARLLAEALRTGQLVKLNEQQHPGCYLHRSHPSDVARTEQCTYICTPTQSEAGPTNNWMAPDAAHATLHTLLDGAMRGRTMYVVPFLMGAKGSAFSKVGLELTDSVYVAINMRIMTRMGRAALEHLGTSEDFVKGLHALGTLDPQQRYVCHFPQDRVIYSINSGYGGNALLGKKCLALRIGSWLGRREGWLAEHMLIMGIESPDGRTTYIAGAFPSACGKTNLAMLQPQGRYKGYRVWCVGDDIAWLRVGNDGRLYATNPEAGFFGVAPGTNMASNPNMMAAISRNALFTNVALLPNRTVWWEGLDLPADPAGMVDWQNQPWQPGCGRKAAHPNARFTVPITQCPVVSPQWNDPAGVPISAILFGARRSTLMPLVCEAFHWAHGTYLGATLASETTAAAVGATGVIRDDPMAMLPFCGYNMADYFAHWLSVGKRLAHPPKIFRVNWFQTDAQGKCIWPGFSENMRVLTWVVDRCEGRGQAVETPIGQLPAAGALDYEGLSLAPNVLAQLLRVDREGWREEAERQTAFFNQFGDRLPAELREEHRTLLARLDGQTVPRPSPTLSGN